MISIISEHQRWESTLSKWDDIWSSGSEACWYFYRSNQQRNRFQLKGAEKQNLHFALYFRKWALVHSYSFNHARPFLNLDVKTRMLLLYIICTCYLNFMISFLSPTLCGAKFAVLVSIQHTDNYCQILATLRMSLFGRFFAIKWRCIICYHCKELHFLSLVGRYLLCLLLEMLPCVDEVRV